MYLEHFGLDEAPFRITPATDFFFAGDNRGEILDALTYAIAESEGIVKVTGEVGSGKTMLCRMLMERLPPQMEAVYLANPSLSREELLYAIADGLGLNLDGQRINIIMQTLQDLLAQKSAAGKRVVVLVDEAHAMPLDTLEELRLLYNLQVGNTKLLHIVLFGQPELNDKLDQPNMRQLKDRIVHNFHMLPLSKPAIVSYLLFRMRTAGYRGPNVFSSAAVKLLGTASGGLMRRVNILADKALLAAFIENTHGVDARHVKAAIRDTQLSPSRRLWQAHMLWVAGAVAVSLVLLIAAVWLFRGMNTGPSEREVSGGARDRKISPPLPPSAAGVPAAVAQPPAQAAPPPAAPATTPAASPAPATPATTAPEKKHASLPALLQQRLSATQALVSKHNKNSASILLYQTEDADPARMERFLSRANGLGKLGEIYLLPVKMKGKESFKVLYGEYPDVEAARAAIPQLPQRYQDAFVPEPYPLDSAR